MRSGARALHKYACGASTKWETVLAGQKKPRAATVPNMLLLATRAKRISLYRRLRWGLKH
eukprot:1718498-Pleurochrysis_carterae.AAC.1